MRFSKTPNVASALCDWFQPMQFTQILKKVVNYKTVEIPTTINFKGMWQPFTAQQLYTMPNINTAWSWFTLHCCTQVDLKVDDVVVYKTKQYRVKSKSDYTEYGYIEYHIILDYEGSGPL